MRGGLDRTASSVILKDDGSLVVELYDFSDEAERHFGNDVASLVTVGAAATRTVLERLGGERGSDGGDGELLRLVGERFGDYFEVVRWLDENGVPYQKGFDPWA